MASARLWIDQLGTEIVHPRSLVFTEPLPQQGRWTIFSPVKIEPEKRAASPDMPLEFAVLYMARVAAPKK
jgi:hypothetical protein